MLNGLASLLTDQDYAAYGMPNLLSLKYNFLLAFCPNAVK